MLFRNLIYFITKKNKNFDLVLKTHAGFLFLISLAVVLMVVWLQKEKGKPRPSLQKADHGDFQSCWTEVTGRKAINANFWIQNHL